MTQDLNTEGYLFAAIRSWQKLAGDGSYHHGFSVGLMDGNSCLIQVVEGPHLPQVIAQALADVWNEEHSSPLLAVAVSPGTKLPLSRSEQLPLRPARDLSPHRSR